MQRFGFPTATLCSLILSSGCEPNFVDPVTRPPAHTFYVSPQGRDDDSGLSPQHAWNKIVRALQVAAPGDVVELLPGRYLQDVRSQRDGLPTAPITIKGPKEAVVSGAGAARVIEINHSHLVLEGFTVDGLAGDATRASGFRDKLVFVFGTGTRQGVRGVRLLGLSLRNAGGECVRLRYFARNNEIAGCSFEGCGLFDFRFGGGGKNGEGIYVGTSPSDLDDGKNPTKDPDESSQNWIHDNIIDTGANECIDVKEAADGNLIERNTCLNQQDADAAAISVRSSDNAIRGNVVRTSNGAAIRIGANTNNQGVRNEVSNNTWTKSVRGGIEVAAGPQGLICGNTGIESGPSVLGKSAVGIDVTSACPAK